MALWKRFRPGGAGVFEKEATLQPDRHRYWLNAKPNHPVKFKQQMNYICQLHQQALNVGAIILSRRLLKRTSFTSTQDLSDSEALLRSADRILAFIDYFNRTMAKHIAQI